MPLLSRLRQLLRATLEPTEVGAEIDEELQFHLEMRAREFMEQGLDEREARARARERFGDLTSVRHECRRLKMLTPTEKGDFVVTGWLRDIRHGFRALMKAPGFSFIVVLTLALAIGANTALFSVVEGVLLRPLPFAESGRLLMLFENDRLRGTTQEFFSAPDYFDLRDRNEVFQSVGAFRTDTLTLTDEVGEPRRVGVGFLTHGLFELLGASPVLGRDVSPEDDVPGAEPVVVLSHGFWTRHFGRDRTVLGERIVLEGIAREVVGVMPPGFWFPSPDAELWTPLQVTPTSNPRGNHSFAVVARLDEGVSLREARANLDAIAGALEVEFPDDNLGRGMWAQPLYQAVVGSVRERLFILLGAVGFVLLVACVNVANLFVARAISREQETAIRAAMGAGRAVLVRQCLAESFLLALGGGVLGVLLAHQSLAHLMTWIPADLPRTDNIGLNATVLGFTLLVTLATAVIFGLAPALAGFRAALTSTLKEGARSGAGRGKHRLRSLLAAAEIALAVALVTGAGLFIGSFFKLSRVDPGFSARNVVVVDLQLPQSRYPQSRSEWPRYHEVRRFQNELLRRVDALSDVDAAAIAINTPLDAGWTSRFQIEGRPEVAPGEQDEVRVRVVSPHYFRTVGIPILRGRSLEPHDDRTDAPPVIVVNQAFVRRYFRDEDPLGARVTQWDLTREIVGIVDDVKFTGLEEETPPAIYPTFSQAPFTGFSLLVRTRARPESVYSRLRGVIWSIDRDLALSGLTTLDEQLSRSVAQPRFTMILFVLFGAVALALAAVGIYGVLSFTVGQRTHEIGIRMSLGARRADVLQLILGHGLRLAGIGIAIGVVLAAIVTRAFEKLLFGVEPLDPIIYGAVSVLAALVGLAASYVPAARATRVDPMLTLRHE